MDVYVCTWIRWNNNVDIKTLTHILNEDACVTSFMIVKYTSKKIYSLESIGPILGTFPHKAARGFRHGWAANPMAERCLMRMRWTEFDSTMVRIWGMMILNRFISGDSMHLWMMIPIDRRALQLKKRHTWLAPFVWTPQGWESVSSKVVPQLLACFCIFWAAW